MKSPPKYKESKEEEKKDVWKQNIIEHEIIGINNIQGAHFL